MHRVGRVLAAARSDRFIRALGIVLVVATVVRVVWVVFAARPPVGIHDPYWYELGATRIAAGDGYTLVNGDPTAYFPVGYPAALAVVSWIGTHTPVTDNLALSAGYAQVIPGVATVALIGLIGRRLFGGRVGIVAAAIAAVFPSQIFYTATLLSETLFNLLLVSALAILVWRRDEDLTWSRIGVAGIVLGLAVLTRPVALAVVPMVGIAWWFGHARWQDALRRTALLGVGAAIVVLPWTVRNVARMGEPILVSTNTGDNLCIGHHPGASGAFELDDWCLEGISGRFTLDDELHRDRTLTRRALRYAISHPGDELVLTWWRTHATFSTDDDGLRAVQSYGEDEFIDPRREDALSTLANGFYFGVLAFAGLGVVAIWSRERPRRLLYLACMVAMLLGPLAFFGDPRFKLPFTLLCTVPAAVTIAALPLIRRSTVSSAG